MKFETKFDVEDTAWCMKDNLATCPGCCGMHFNVLNDGRAVCSSVMKPGEFGCGWIGNITRINRSMRGYYEADQPILRHIV